MLVGAERRSRRRRGYLILDAGRSEADLSAGIMAEIPHKAGMLDLSIGDFGLRIVECLRSATCWLDTGY